MYLFIIMIKRFIDFYITWLWIVKWIVFNSLCFVCFIFRIPSISDMTASGGFPVNVGCVLLTDSARLPSMASPYSVGYDIYPNHPMTRSMSGDNRTLFGHTSMLLNMFYFDCYIVLARLLWLCFPSVQPRVILGYNDHTLLSRCRY